MRTAIRCAPAAARQETAARQGQARRGFGLRRAWRAYLCLPAALWLLLWCGIDTGPWNLESIPGTARGWSAAIRALLPLSCIGILILRIVRSRGRLNAMPAPLRWWAGYGFIGTIASGALSPAPVQALYFGGAYLAAIGVAAAYLSDGDGLDRAARLNHVTWGVATGILAILCLVARDALRESVVGGSWSTYDVMNRVGGQVWDMPMSRSTGFARFAAVPAIVAFVWVWRGRALRIRIACAALFLGSVLLVYLMQARGTNAGLVFGLAAATFAMGRRSRAAGLLFVGIGIFAVAVEILPPAAVGRFAAHLTREQSGPELLDMSGRLGIWEDSVQLIMNSPFIGHGFQADRVLGIGHVHNTLLYVLLTSGLLGCAAFVAGIASAWVAAVRAIWKGLVQNGSETVHFAQSLGILAYFTARSIPEVSGGLYSVDLLVMIPVMAYLWAIGSTPQQVKTSFGRAFPAARHSCVKPGSEAEFRSVGRPGPSVARGRATG